MANIFSRLLGNGYVWADLKEGEEILCNPGRGFYRIYNFMVEVEPDFSDSIYEQDVTESLALVIINIGSYNNRDLDHTAIERMGRILDFFEQNNKDIILRVTYDHLGKALEREPNFFAQVSRHVEQIGDFIKDHADRIFIYQGVLLGNWGEMHTSKHLSDEKLQKLIHILRQKKDEGYYLAVRCPVQWRKLHPGTGMKHLYNPDKMGIFDDAILSSPTDMGTFGFYEEENGNWNSMWHRDAELQFMQKLCEKVPNGGEVVWGEGFSDKLSEQEIISALSKMHISYLNKMHDKKMLEYFKHLAKTEDSLWNGKRLYDYIEAHMGYRFLAEQVKSAGKNMISLLLHNTGFAPLYGKGKLFLDWETKEEKGSIPIDFSLEELGSGERKRILISVENAKGKLYLRAIREKGNRLIHFGNKGGTGERLFLGEIQK